MHHALHFMGQVASNLRQTGAIVPSSRRLARAMARAAGEVGPGRMIIELGPGSGSTTVALVERFGGPAVLAIESNPHFAAHVNQRCPSVHVVEGCASRIIDHIHTRGIAPERIAAVVSSLPLLVMPADLVERIFTAIAEVLPAGGRFVQYTYSGRAWRRFQPQGFRPERPQRVWFNMPPAVVLPFVRRSS